jgi:drug/metabolite transporter superfamily protein YnfA
MAHYVGIASCLFSAFVCWLCFIWRRRFSSAVFTLCGTLALFAFLWSAVVTFIESRSFSSREFESALYHHWRQSGSVSPDTTLEAFQHRINAQSSSRIISNAALSFIVTFVAGLIATATFGRAAYNARANASSPNDRDA